MTPNDRPPTASAATTEPSQSNRRRASTSRDSATWRSVTHSATARTGTLMRNGDPPADRVDQQAADERADQGESRRRRGPDAERATALGPSENVCVMIESAPGTMQRAGRALEEPEHDQHLERRGEAAQAPT